MPVKKAGTKTATPRRKSGKTGKKVRSTRTAAKPRAKKATTRKTADKSTKKPLASGMAKVVSEKAGAVVDKLKKEPSGAFVTAKTFTQFTEMGSQVTYHTHGLKLNGSAKTGRGKSKPEQILLEVPPQHRGLRLVHVELTHSQELDDKTSDWSGKKEDNDTTPGKSQVEFHIEGNGWTSLGTPAKFAENREEIERLHDLPKASGPIDAVRIKAVGVDPVHIHRLTLHFLPEKPDSFDELIFTSGTSFGDPWNGIAPSVNRSREEKVKGNTRYPGGVTLANDGDWAKTPKETLAKIKKKGWRVDHDSIRIPLKPGTRLRTVEVAIGDTHPDSKKNHDGSYGYKGYAKLNVSVRQAGEWYGGIRLSEDENIPPQGVLVGSTDYVAKKGDQIIISVDSDTAGVMGVRVGFAKK